MIRKHQAAAVILLLLALSILAACGGAEPQVIEVNRMVTEEVIVEGESVEVTRVVVEEVIVEAEEVVSEAMQATPAATAGANQSGNTHRPPKTPDHQRWQYSCGGTGYGNGR